MKKNIFRLPKDGEKIEYNCGCLYIVEYKKNEKPVRDGGYVKNEITWTVVPDLFCVEHDPTLTDYAKQNENKIAMAME